MAWRCFYRSGTNLRPLIQFVGSNHTLLGKRGIVLYPTLRDVQRINMPALSPTMQQGTIVQWYKKEGEKIEPGDVICDIQTDKAVVGFELEEEGVLAKIMKPENSKDVAIGTVIALMVDEDDDWKNVEVPQGASSEPAAADTKTTPREAAAPQPVSTAHDHWLHGVGPAAKGLMDQYGISPSDVTGTGPASAIIKGDVLKLIETGGLKPKDLTAPLPTGAAVTSPSPVSPAAVSVAPPPPTAKPARVAPSSFVGMDTEAPTDIPLTTMRSVIAKRLTESKTTIPHAYATINCRLDRVTELRTGLLETGVKVSMNDFIVKAAALALQRVPAVNSQWLSDQAKYLTDIDISVAVATENGLITPIVRNAVGKSVQEIAADIKDLATRAKANKLQPQEFQGGSFTISNLGMFGITEFSAVINPPQTCILAIGSGRLVPGPLDEPVTLMTVTLSADARVVDDHIACQFLESFRDVLENPVQMMTSGPAQPLLHSAGVSLNNLFAK